MKTATVLIIEDEQILQDVYSLILGSKGYTVAVAENGAEGLTKMRAVKPDLILLDVLMPVMDGKEFLKNFDASEFPYTKIIAYTNLSDRQTQQEMVELGAMECVLKSSMTPEDLLNLVGQVLETGHKHKNRP